MNRCLCRYVSKFPTSCRKMPETSGFLGEEEEVWNPVGTWRIS